MNNRPKSEELAQNDLLKGTTYRVYRLFLKQRKPISISGVQKALGLSSPSVAQYHIRKLLAAGLLRDEQDGYVIDRVIIDNVIHDLHLKGCCYGAQKVQEAEGAEGRVVGPPCSVQRPKTAEVR